MRKFELKVIGGYDSIAPSTGEELGEMLARFAATEMERCIALPEERVMYWGDKVAQLFHLAADAYEAGASVTMGHNRSDRYLAAAVKHRNMGNTLTTQAAVFRIKAESERMLGAFMTGYRGGVGNYAFEMREAFIIGKLFAKEGRQPPAEIYKVYAPRPLTKDSPRDHIKVDDEQYVIEYPDGKVNEAYAVKID